MRNRIKIFSAIGKFFNNSWILALLFISYGLFLAYHDSLMSNFYFLPGGCDGRLNHYFLEHSWLWLSGKQLHGEFWNAPFFYPVKNVMAYSDILLGSAPIYWLCRGMGISEVNSFLLWPPTVAALNWVCMYLLLKRGFYTDNLSAATGAFLFAFCAPRLGKMVHLQLWPQFYTALFIYFIIIYYRQQNNSAFKAHIAIIGASICAALQLYAGFYLGWFLLFSCTIFIISLFLFDTARAQVLYLLRKDYGYYVLCLSFFIILVSPMLIHYIEIQKSTGLRSWSEILLNMPDLKSWFSTPAFIYENLDYIANANGEKWIGIGFLSFFIAIYGLIKFSIKNIWIRTLLITFIIIFCIITFRIGWLNAWKMIYLLYPGASAIRVVSRMFFILLPVLCIGYALTMKSSKNFIKLILMAAILLENARYGIMANTRSQYEVCYNIALEAQKNRLPFVYISDADCGIFDKNLDAMWASIFSARKTFNGYSGNAPSFMQYEVSATPLDKIGDSEFLSHISEPYFLITNKHGQLDSKVVEAK